jgi:TetR/AcrR family transcriptional repressor of nem operon
MPRVKLFDREEVLARAMELFWKKGFYSTSIQDLVDHLGVNRASLYDTFGGKDELFEQAFRLYQESNRRNMVNFLNSQKSVKKGLLNLFRNSILQSAGDPDLKGCFVVNTTTEMVPADQKMKELLTSNRIEFEKIFHDYLQKGVSSGEISKEKDLKAIASLVFTLYNGLKVVSKVNSNPNSLLKMIKAGLSVLD